MASVPRRWSCAPLALLLAAGGCYPFQDTIDPVVCDVAAHPVDLQPLTAADQGLPDKPAADAGVKPAPFDQPNQRAGDRLQVPDAFLPNGPLPHVELPEDRNDPRREQILNQLFPPMPALGPDPQAVAGPEGRPLSLADLQKLALADNPQFRQAQANVAAMRGAAIEAGLLPNPTIGFENDTLGTGTRPGYLGGFFNQVIKTGNKLQLQRAVAVMDLRNAEVAFTRAKTDLTHNVRGGYFQVLTARENMRISRALADFSANVYQIEVENIRKGGFAAPYEAMQLRVLAWQAQANLVQARNRYTSVWKQLAAALGLPGMPPTDLAGGVDLPIPVYDHAAVLTHALRAHTDVLTADNSLLQAKFRLALAKIQVVPDVTLNVVLQKDFTGPPFGTVASVQAGVPVPIFDRNQGGVMQAQAQLIQASDEGHRVRDDLTTRLATAFETYENNRVLLRLYRDKILPDQVQAYRLTYKRYMNEAAPAAPPGAPITSTPAFADVVVAQQNLAQSLITYVATVGAMWQAVADVADVLQTDDLFQVGLAGPCPEATAVPSLADLPGLPCFHPCAPLPEPNLKGGDGAWPNVAPNLDDTPKDAPQSLQLPLPPPSQATAPPTPGPTPPAVFTGVHAEAEDAPLSHRAP